MNKEEITFEDLKARTANFIENAKISLQGIQFEFVYPYFLLETPFIIFRILHIERPLHNFLNSNGCRDLIRHTAAHPIT